MCAAFLAELHSLGLQALGYIFEAIADTYAVRQAVASGDRNAVVQALLDGARDAQAGAYHTQPNPALYQLASETGLLEVVELASEVAAGRKGGDDVRNTMGLFADQVREALRHPYDV